MTVETDIENLEAALASGEKRVKVGDRDVEYRDISEIKAAIAYKKSQLDPDNSGSVTYAAFERG